MIYSYWGTWMSGVQIVGDEIYNDFKLDLNFPPPPLFIS